MIGEDHTMATKQLPPQDYLCKRLRYDENSGKLFFLPRPIELFDAVYLQTAEQRQSQWNSRWAGKEAFTAETGAGYCTGHLDSTLYYAHRIIWKMCFGDEPQIIDHRNGVKSDNRLSNLRACDSEKNLWNIPARCDSGSGMQGVKRSGNGKGWIVRIRHQKTTIALGTHKCFGLALRARREAELSLRGSDYANKQIGNRPNQVV